MSYQLELNLFLASSLFFNLSKQSQSKHSQGFLAKVDFGLVSKVGGQFVVVGSY
jgi:hypothetical protein